MRKAIAVTVGVVVLAFLVLWLVYLALRRGAGAVRVPIDATPAAFGVRYSDVSFPTRGGGLTLRGWWMPASASKGVVIFVHGGNGNRRDVYAGGLEMEAFLVRQGYSVLAFDQRNHGRSDASADGQITLGIEESIDVLGAVDYVAKREPFRAVTCLPIRWAARPRSMPRRGTDASRADADRSGAGRRQPWSWGALYANLGLPHAMLPAIALERQDVLRPSH